MERLISILLLVMLCHNTNSQSLLAQNEVPLKVVGYLGIVHPIALVQNGIVSTNFNRSYSVGFPVGINIQKKPHFGYSLEIAPFIVANDSVSSVKFVLIHPGLYFPLKKGWTITTRLAFETNGRFGMTPSVSKVLLKGNTPISVTLPISFRFGSARPPSIGTAILFTIAF